MSRFIRSAFFPILVVIILAIVVQMALHRTGNGTKSSVKPQYHGQFVVANVPSTVPESRLANDLAAGVVQKVVVDSQTMAALVTTSASATSSTSSTSGGGTPTPAPSASATTSSGATSSSGATTSSGSTTSSSELT